jgi:dihydrofolate reductase
MGDQRKIIVRIATSADGFIARRDGDLEWLTSRHKPKGFYGISEFVRSVDTGILGRKTYEEGKRLGGTFEPPMRYVVFSRRPRPADSPQNVEWVNAAIGPFTAALRQAPGKNIWLMGGAELIGAFLDERAIDELAISVMPVFIGDGIPLIAPRHRHVPLDLLAVQQFDDGVVQLRYRPI